MPTKHERIQASAAAAETTDNLIIQQNNAKLIKESMGNAILVALERIGLKCEGYAKGLCPVDTGRLRNSITHAISNNEEAVYVGSNVEYAKYVELSAKHAQPFLRPAANNHVSEYRDILRKELSGS